MHAVLENKCLQRYGLRKYCKWHIKLVKWFGLISEDAANTMRRVRVMPEMDGCKQYVRIPSIVANLRRNVLIEEGGLEANTMRGRVDAN